jgi:tetratricopeptide (TPR) repeat protein
VKEFFEMKTFLTGLVVLAIGVTSLMAQPKPKSQKEVDALMAIQNAQTAEARIQAVDKLITGFADTEFKDWALFMAASTYASSNQPEKAIVYAERTVEANPKHFQALLMLAEVTTQRTGEHDLDREEKLTRAAKYANDAIAAVGAASKPNPQMPDDQWAAAKKDVVAQAHQALGMVALSRKKNDVAIAEFKQAIEGASQPEPAFDVRLAQAYVAAGKFDEAIATAQKVMDQPNVHPQIKQVAQAIRASAMQAKGGAKPTTVTPGQVEIKKP